MSSEIRANTLKNRVGLGTVSYTNTGIIVSGIVTANSFKGDGSSLTGIDATTLKDSAGNIKIQAQASGAIHSGISTFNDDVRFITDNGGNILIDKSDNTIRLGQSVGLFYGTNKMWMQHNGSVGYLHNVTGSLYIRNEDSSGDIYIQGKSGEHSIICNYDGDVQLYHDAGLRLSTTSGGISVSGDVSVSGNMSPGGTIYLTGDVIHTDDTNTKFGFGGGDDTFRVQTGGSTRLHIHTDGRFRVGCTQQPSGTVSGFQLDMGSYPGTMRLQSGAGASGTTSASFNLGGSNYHANLHNGSNSGASISLTNFNTTDGNSTSVSFLNSNQLAIARILGVNISHSSRNGALVFMTSTASYPTEKMRLDEDGKLGINRTSPAERLEVGGNIAIISGSYKIDTHPLVAYANFTDISGGSYAARLGSTGTSTIRSTQIYGGGGHIATFDGVNKRLGINLTIPTAKLHVSAAYNETGATITGGALGYNDVLQCNTANGHRRFTVAGDGEIYGPSGGRKNWFDNGSFDCIGGRRANTSMDYGNHHAYGWVTDRFQSRNAVQWSRSTNVPTGKGFSYSTQTNGGGGSLVQAVELPDYGDMGVFTPSSYWCVSVWSTTTIINSAAAFSYDLGTTKTNCTLVDNTTNNYASTGETASGTSTGTFTRYYKVFQMPSSIISGAIALYFTWFLQNAGYATGWQLERVPTSTSKPTPYEHVHPSVTIARCRRYCFQNVNSRLFNGYKRHDSNIHWSEQFPVPPTHMPSGSNQGATPYGIHLHDGGLLTNFQGILQNPGVNSVSLSEFDYRSGRVIIVGSTNYGSTHVTVPSWESQEYEIMHGFF